KPELSPHRRSTRPGCEGVLVRLPFAPRAVLLHLDRDSPASKPGFFSNCRSTRPGCEGVLVRLPFAPRAVLLHLDRDSPASKPGFFSNRRSTRPGCEGFGPGLRGSVGERCAALITASIEALAIADQHGAEVVIVAGSALDAAGGIKPEFQPLVMHATEAQGAIRQLLADHRQLTSILGIAAGQQHAAGTYIHPPAIGQTEADPPAVSGTGVHATAPGGFDPVGPVD